ncbi:outer membrane beta-barrel protein [Gaetbulibacter sp. M240]|uniref:outer membrane beta-barrel protein n=1 Tax=Gaetbulibacter sp. M240 TaxID=3126511 RepID=UPI00374F817E
MKNLLLFSFLSVFIFSAKAQTQFGLTAGYFGVSSKSFTIGGSSLSGTASGFYVGAMADFKTSEKLHLQPELLYANANSNDVIIIPILLKYYTTEKFSIQAGPQASYILEDASTNYTPLGLALATGLGYDITQNFFLQARYSVQINNYYNGNEDFRARDNFFTVGVGYKFN